MIDSSATQATRELFLVDRDRDRERQRDRGTERDRERDRETEKHRHRETVRQVDSDQGQGLGGLWQTTNKLFKTFKSEKVARKILQGRFPPSGGRRACCN